MKVALLKYLCTFIRLRNVYVCIGGFSFPALENTWPQCYKLSNGVEVDPDVQMHRQKTVCKFQLTSCLGAVYC